MTHTCAHLLPDHALYHTNHLYRCFFVPLTVFLVHVQPEEYTLYTNHQRERFTPTVHGTACGLIGKSCHVLLSSHPGWIWASSTPGVPPITPSSRRFQDVGAAQKLHVTRRQTCGDEALFQFDGKDFSLSHVCVCANPCSKGCYLINRGTGHLWHFPSNEEDASRC